MHGTRVPAPGGNRADGGREPLLDCPDYIACLGIGVAAQRVQRPPSPEPARRPPPTHANSAKGYGYKRFHLITVAACAPQHIILKPAARRSVSQPRRSVCSCACAGARGGSRPERPWRQGLRKPSAGAAARPNPIPVQGPPTPKARLPGDEISSERDAARGAARSLDSRQRVPPSRCGQV